MTKYEIVQNIDGIWTADGLGSPNAFANPDQAEDAIGGLSALGDEWRVGIYAVRKIGNLYIEPGTRTEGPDEVCLYCEAQVPRRDVPSYTDDEGWREASRGHRTDCEWVTTRAFRVIV